MDLSCACPGIWIATAVLLILVANYFQYKKLAAGKSVSFKFLLSPIFVLIIAPILLLTFPIFLILRQIVSLILRVKYGVKYWGLLDGRDAIYNLDSKNPIYILLIIGYQNSKEDFYDVVRKTMKETLEKYSKQNSKIFGVIRTFMGYSYILKNEIKIDDCLKKLKTTKLINEELSKDNLLGLMTEYANVPLPNNYDGLWDVLIGTQPVKWSKSDNSHGKQSYPVILRFHHSLTDGAHIFNCIKALFEVRNNFKNEKIINIKQNLVQQNTYDSKPLTLLPIKVFNLIKSAGNKLKFYTIELYAIFTGFSVPLVNSLLAVSDWHILHGPRPTKKLHFFVNDEESSKNLQLVKKIKRNIPRSTFIDIIFTAIAASFKDYFLKNSKNIPDYITTEVPSIPPEEWLDSNAKPRCRNRLTFSLRKLPIGVNTVSLMDTLETIMREGASVKNSIEEKVNYTFLKTFCSWIPATLLRLVVNMTHNCTLLISNLPGPAEYSVKGGYLLEDLVPWNGIRANTGMGFVIVSYGDRLRMSLAVDEALIASRTQAKTLLDDVFKYLDKLERETADLS